MHINTHQGETNLSFIENLLCIRIATASRLLAVTQVSAELRGTLPILGTASSVGMC